jgi:hypothetical protein
MASPIPFRTKKGEEYSAWKAVVNGNIVELAPSSATKEEASAKLSPMIQSSTDAESKRKTNISSLLGNSGQIVQEEPLPSGGSKASASPADEKPKPGELRKNGLADLSPARLKAFRDQVAFAIASGNVSLDRALVSIFRDKVPFLAPENYLMLSTGWELACEQYFVNGVPPAWIIILLGNAMLCTSLFEHSEPKKEEALPTNDGTVANPRDKPLTH